MSEINEHQNTKYQTEEAVESEGNNEEFKMISEN
jgi:hypothetical protein